jgi:hypothetical protein
MGIADKLNRRRECPVCRGLVNTRLKSLGLLCKSCDTYLDLVDDKLVPMDEKTLKSSHEFAAALPWKDVGGGVTFPGGIAHPMVQLTDMLTTKRDSKSRILDAKWPDYCCVCGGPTARRQRLARAIIIPREWGMLNLGSKQITLVADGVPHCAEHATGIVFDRVTFDSHNTGGDMSFAIKFRWLGYRNAFRKANPWPWSKF